MTPRYASNTEVSCEQTRMEIERTLNRYGAEGFAFATVAQVAKVEFQMRNRHIRFILKLPSLRDFQNDRHGNARPDHVQRKHWDQACRSRWRGLLILIKGSLQAVEDGTRTFDHAFLGDIVLESGRTLAEEFLPQIEEATRQGKMPRLSLPAPED